MREMRPRHIVLFIASCLVLLGAICTAYEFARPVFGDLRWKPISTFIPLDTIHSADSVPQQPIRRPRPEPVVWLNDSSELLAEVEAEEKVEAEKATPETKVVPDTLPAVKPSAGALDAFIAGLQEAGTRQVRVVHYGDSQIEEDRITATIRRQLQALYGGGGPGILPLYQTIPTRTVRQSLTVNGKTASMKTAPQRYLVYGPKSQQRDSNNYGPMGQVALMDTLLKAGTDNLVMRVEPNGKLTSANHFNQVRLLKTAGVEVNARSGNILSLPEGSSECTLEFTGQGEVYGVSLETETGVIVDNIPMRGGSGNVFTKISEAQLRQFFRETNTRLIILQFGGNVMPWADTPERVRGYANSMRRQIRYLQACAPNASILFVGPSDMTTVIEGEKTTYPMLPQMDRQLAKMAASEGIAYWSLYEAMGGWNSMQAWNEKGLAATDGVHFSQRGADKAGGLLWQWLEKKIGQK